MLLVLVVVSAILGRFWRRTLLEKLPVASIALCFLLLTFTTSKWIWHFGALVGLCAVAVGVEVDRLRAVRLLTAVRWTAAVVVLVTGLWAARGSFQWTTFETGSAPAWNGVPYVPVLLAAAGAALVLLFVVRRSRADRSSVPVGPALAICSSPSSWRSSGRRPSCSPSRPSAQPHGLAARQAEADVAGRGTLRHGGRVDDPAPGSIRPLARLGSSSRPISGRHGGCRSSGSVYHVGRSACWSPRAGARARSPTSHSAGRRPRASVRCASGVLPPGTLPRGSFCPGGC